MSNPNQDDVLYQIFVALMQGMDAASNSTVHTDRIGSFSDFGDQNYDRYPNTRAPSIRLKPGRGAFSWARQVGGYGPGETAGTFEQQFYFKILGNTRKQVLDELAWLTTALITEDVSPPIESLPFEWLSDGTIAKNNIVGVEGTFFLSPNLPVLPESTTVAIIQIAYPLQGMNPASGSIAFERDIEINAVE